MNPIQQNPQTSLNINTSSVSTYSLGQADDEKKDLTGIFQRANLQTFDQAMSTFTPYEIPQMPIPIFMTTSMSQLPPAQQTKAIDVKTLQFLPRDQLIYLLIQNPKLVHENSIKNRLHEIAHHLLKIIDSDLKFPDILPPGIKGLLKEFGSSITSFDISGLKYITSKDLLRIWKWFPNLQEINISCCFFITDFDVQKIANCYPNLTNLNLAGNYHINAQSLARLAWSCPNLKSVNLSAFTYPMVTPGICAITERCQHLESLELSLNAFSDREFWKILVHGLNLRHLNLRLSSHLTDTGLSVIPEFCPDLESLDLALCSHLTNAGIVAAVSCWTHLKDLNLMQCGTLINAGLRAVAEHCPNLERLNISQCTQINDDGIRAAAPHLQRLKDLCIAWNSLFTNASLRVIVEQCPHITSLDISRCSSITAAGIEAIAEHYPNLRHLRLEGCNSTDAAITTLCEHCSHLESLSLSYCTQLTNAVIPVITKQCPAICQLSLSGCTGLTDAGIVALASFSLEKLDLFGCQALTDASLRALAINCPNLREVQLARNEKYTVAGISALVEGCYNLESIHLNPKLEDGINKLRGQYPHVQFSIDDE